MSANGSHLPEIRRKRDGSVPGVGPIDEQGLADEQVALDVVIFLEEALLVFKGPKAAVVALRAVVAHREELILRQFELHAAAVALGKEPARFPLRGIGKDFADAGGSGRELVVGRGALRGD